MRSKRSCTPSSKPLKIIQIVNTLAVSDGGPSRNSFELNKALNRHEACDADLYWISGNLAETVLFADGALVRDIPTPGPRKISRRTNHDTRSRSLVSFICSIYSADILIIHGYYLPWIPFFAVAAWLFGCRTFLMPHGALTSRQQKYSTRKKWLFDLVPGRVLRGALDAFVTGSPVERDELIAKFPSADVRVAGVGVPMPTTFKKMQRPHSPLRLLSMSRIAEKKRIDLSIEAIGHLRNSGVEATLVIAGEGQPALVDELRAHACSLGVSDRVQFVGQISGLAKETAFLSSDVFLLPSEDENFGIGFAEAMSFGLPSVVSTNVASASKLPLDAGRLLDAPTGERLAAAVIEITDSGRFAHAQLASRAFAIENFSWSAAADKWMEAITANDSRLQG